MPTIMERVSWSASWRWRVRIHRLPFIWSWDMIRPARQALFIMLWSHELHKLCVNYIIYLNDLFVSQNENVMKAIILPNNSSTIMVLYFVCLESYNAAYSHCYCTYYFAVPAKTFWNNFKWLFLLLKNRRRSRVTPFLRVDCQLPQP